MSYYLDYVRYYSKLSFHIAQINEWIDKNKVEKTYHEICAAKNEITFMRPLLVGINAINDTAFQKAIDNIELQKEKILDSFEKWFDKAVYIGDKKAYQQPDVLIVLGGNKFLLDERLKVAFDFLKTNSNIRAVFSGGGFSSNETEAEYMYKKATVNKITNEILLEKTSMDTIGNVLFTKFELQKTGWMSDINKLLIITSRFHAIRAHYCFKNIFNTGRPIFVAVKGAPNQNQDLQKLSAHEMTTEYQAQTNLDIFNVGPKKNIDDQAILLKLFQNHQLYKNRYDILERYLKDA